jgi:peptidoglycan/xylan/chitin deacetylase (PgdA/CDA1 family)
MRLPNATSRVAAATAKMAVRQILHRVPTRLWRRLLPRTEIGFCYHMVSDTTLPHLKHYYNISTADFDADLIYLQKTFGIISYQQLLERRNSPNPAHDTSVILTFDDGFAECATTVSPTLLRRGADCIFFIVTDLVDNAVVFRETAASLCIDAVLRLSIAQVEAIVRDLGLDAVIRPPPETALFDPTRLPLDVADLGCQPDHRLRPLLHWLLTVRVADVDLIRQLAVRLGVDPLDYVRTTKPYLTTQQIRQLQADGFMIGAHGLGHHRLQDLSRAAAEREIVESCRIVRDMTGQANVPFAFPYSGEGIDRTWLEELRRKHDFIGLFFDTGGLRNDAPFVVQRVFGERFGVDRTVDAILRRAWARRTAWHRSDWANAPSR